MRTNTTKIGTIALIKEGKKGETEKEEKFNFTLLEKQIACT